MKDKDKEKDRNNNRNNKTVTKDKTLQNIPKIEYSYFEEYDNYFNRMFSLFGRYYKMIKHYNPSLINNKCKLSIGIGYVVDSNNIEGLSIILRAYYNNKKVIGVEINEPNSDRKLVEVTNNFDIESLVDKLKDYYNRENKFNDEETK